MPGSMLEAPETFQAVSAPWWPRLHVALGYTGGARWVAFFVSGHQARYHDGASSAEVVDPGLFLAYRHHPKIAAHLAGAHLGSEDEEARTWLLLDTYQCLCYLAEPEGARQFLVRQWPREGGIPLELSPEN